MTSYLRNVCFGVGGGYGQLYLEKGYEQFWDLFEEKKQPAGNVLLFGGVEL